MLKRLIRYAAGLALCVALWGVGEFLRSEIALPLPGGVIGFALLYGILHICPKLAPGIETGCDLLVSNLILFFIPAVLSVISYPEFFGMLGVKVLFTLLASTALVMIAVGLLAQFLASRSTDFGAEQP